MDNKGPAPYLNTVPQEGRDPVVKTVDFDNAPIGAGPAAVPKATRSNGMGLQHYGTDAGSGK